MGDWRRVTRKDPCPICGRTGWCAVSANGEVCLCMREPSDWPATGGMGGHFHRLTPETRPVVARATPRPRRTAFDLEERATVSDWIISQLTLERGHWAHLRSPQRHLDDLQVVRRRYRSWPDREVRARLALHAFGEFGSAMYRYPGFYVDRTDHPMFAGPSGLLLPVAGAPNQVKAFQIRPDDPSCGKRIWLSSSGRRRGTSSGAPAHFSFPRFTLDPFTAYVVEGVLSADICSDILGAVCVGLAGKTNWRILDGDGFKLNFIERIVVALDQDDLASSVNAEAVRIATSLGADFEVQVACWDGVRAKGFDDCLLLSGEFKFI